MAQEEKKCWSPLQKFSWTQTWSPSIWAQSQCCLSYSLQSNRHPLTYTGLFETSANQDAPGGMCPQWWRMWQGHSCDMGRAVKQKIDRGRGGERHRIEREGEIAWKEIAKKAVKEGWEHDCERGREWWKKRKEKGGGMKDRQRERMGTFFLQHFNAVFLKIEQTCKDSGTFLTLINFPCSSKGHNLPVQWAMMQSAPHKGYSNGPLKCTASLLFIKQRKCAMLISKIDETHRIQNAHNEHDVNYRAGVCN